MNGDISPQVMELLNNPNEAKRQINQFAQDNLQGINPEEQVKQLVNSGKMTQGQYNMLSKFAGMFMKFM